MADYPLKLVTPERTVYEGSVQEAILQGSEGELGVLAHHMPLITALKPCVVRVVESNGNHRRFAIGGGFLEVGRDGTVVLADTAELPEEIDRDRAEAARQRALSRMDTTAADMDIARAKAALERAEARLATLAEPLG